MSAWAVAALVLVLASAASAAVPMSNRYRSPRNHERRIRSSTQLIVLHTTEAPARSSLNKVSDRGECHFCVTEDGTVYRIVDRDREAFHAGRSMWNGREDVDKFSVGIECVGYHNRRMPDAQLNAIRDLVKELKAMYRIPDERVVCHSHVAYGAPNRWHRFKHRGRKRCGMLFAMPSVRRRLDLRMRPAYDPDTRARRLRNADEYLRQVLYGPVDTMAPFYGAARAVVRAAAPKTATPKTIVAKPAAQKAAVAKPVAPKPPSPKPVVAKPVAPPKAAAKPVAPKPTVAKPGIAAKKPAAAARPSAAPASIAELKARGYVVKGTVSKNVSAAKIAGAKWNAPDTYYTIRNKVIPGSRIDAAHIEKGMNIWMKK